MSRERCVSVERDERRETGDSFIRRRSPILTPDPCAFQQHIPGTPEIFRRDLQDGIPSYAVRDFGVDRRERDAEAAEEAECRETGDSFIRRRSPRRMPDPCVYQQHIPGTPEIFRRDLQDGIPSYAVRDFGVDRREQDAEATEEAEVRETGDSFIRRRSPKRTPDPCAYQQHIPGTPEIFRRDLQDGIPSYAVRDFGVDRRERDAEAIEEAEANAASRFFQMENLPNELLDEYEEPSFYDIPPNASFEEVMCTMATPPPPNAAQQQAAAPTVGEKLDELRADVAQVIKVDDLRKRMAAHIGSGAVEETTDTVQIDDVRKRIAALISESSSEPPLCPIKIPPLPDDLHAIPPPPKNPKDVAAIIRRAQAIARLKAYEEAKLAAQAPKGAIKKGLKGIAVTKKLPVKMSAQGLQKPAAVMKPALGLQKPAVGIQKRLAKTTAAPKLRKKCDTGKFGVGGIKKKAERAPSPQRPPDYVPDEWAAAILRTRKLAGLKTTNPRLLPKLKIPSPVPVKTPVTQPSAEKPLPTFDSVMQRAAAIRSKTNIAKITPTEQKIPAQKPRSHVLEDELDDFEALEELYGANAGGPCTVIEDSPIAIQERIDTLQQQLLQTPPQEEIQEELDEFEALEEMYGATSYDKEPQATTADMQDRINTLQQQLLESPTPIFEVPSILRYQNLLSRRDSLAAAAAKAGSMRCISEEAIEEYEDNSFEVPNTPPTLSRPVSRPGTPLRSLTPVSSTPARSRRVCPTEFNDDILQNIDMPDFDINDVPEFAFSEEALADAGFEIGDELTSLGDISMPDFDADISMDEYGLEDVSSPDLCDLSISSTELALEPDYPLEISSEEDEAVAAIEQVVEKEPKQSGFLTELVNAVVDRVKSIFSPGKSKDDQVEEEGEDEFNLDSSLPNMFETSPPPKSPSPEKEICVPVQVVKKAKSPEGPIVIPPHPKDPKDYKAIIRRAQAIQKKKAQEAAAAPPLPTVKEKRGKQTIKSTIPKRVPQPARKAPSQRKRKQEKKVYPPGEYSPSDIRAVARARSLAGLKNRSDLLNPERAAKLAELKAAQEAKRAAIEALPPVERMRKKMEGLKKCPGVLPRPSIEMLGALEAIRANLPVAQVKRKWRPAGRLRVDRRVKKKDRIFRKDFGRILVPTEKNQKKKNWRPIDVMSPIVEEDRSPENLMQFSPLKPHEGQQRLRYLKEQAASRVAEIVKAAEEAQEAISLETSRHEVSSENCRSPEISPLHFSPVQLQSPTSPRTEETRRERVITQIGPNGGEETIREEVTEISTIKNGEVHTSTRTVTTKTDEYGNVTCHIQEGKGEDEAMPEDLADIEPPDFLDTSDIPPPGDSSIPTPAEIIDRIRTKVQQKLDSALPDISQTPRSPIPTSPGQIEFPCDLTDENLCEFETPEFPITPQKTSPTSKSFTPIEKDARMYAWGERPPSTPPPTEVRHPTPKIKPPSPEPVEHIKPQLKPKSPEQIVIPPHPKDPKDYVAMIKRAQAIQRLQQQQEKIRPRTAPEPLPPKGKTGRVPISRWVGPPPKDPRLKPRKRMVLKKCVPKAIPKERNVQKVEDEEIDIENPAEPPELPQEYRDAVARARLLRGLKNKTAALNPKIAAKKAAEEAERAAYEALPEYEKIKKRMEKLRKIPAKKRNIKPSADILGTIAAIRANMPPIEEVLRQPTPPRASPVVEEIPAVGEPPSPRTPIKSSAAPCTPRAPVKVRARSKSPSPTPAEINEFEYMEEIMGAKPVAYEVCTPFSQEVEDEALNLPDISLLRPYVSPSEQRRSRSPSPRVVAATKTATPINFADLSLEEFENLEAQAMADESLDEFEALEAEAQNLYDYETPKRREWYFGRELVPLFSEQPGSMANKTKPRSPVIDLLTPSPQCLQPEPRYTPPIPNVPIPSMRELGLQGFFEEQGVFNESILGSEPIVRPHISPRPDAQPDSIYYDPMLDFRMPEEDVLLNSSLLMPKTPPKNLQEKFERLKRAQERQISPKYSQVHVSPTAPVELSPIRLYSPSGAGCEISEPKSPVFAASKEELLVDIDAVHQRQAAAKQFRDLEDMPFDELEYELEPSLVEVSLEKPISPPPRPSDIITRIRSKVQRDLRERPQRSPQKSPAMLEMPENLPEEDLLELSAPSFALTPPRTPPAKQRSPRESLPMAWGEVRPPTPRTLTPRKSSPIKIPTPSQPQHIEEKITSPVCALQEGPVVIPPHPKDPKDYLGMIRRAQAIHKLKKQEAERVAKAPPSEIDKKRGRVPISRWVGPPPRKVSAKPRKKLVLRKRVPLTKEKKQELLQPPLEEEGVERKIPSEPPQLPQEYRDAVARARLLRGLKNRTAALNPKIAAKKAAEEAAAAEFAALPEHEKIKVRMERLRKKPGSRRAAKPTMEQIAFLEALKQTGAYQATSPRPRPCPPSPKPLTPRTSPVTRKVPSPRQLSPSPRADLSKMREVDLEELAEFEALEQLEMSPVCPPISAEENATLQQRITELEQLLETDQTPQAGDDSLAEFEALEALEAPVVCQSQPDVTAMNLNQIISNLQREQLTTPPRINPKERYQQLLAQRQATPPTPVISPVKTPEFRYSPLTLADSPLKNERTKRAEKSTTQITRSGDNTIKERVIETSEIVNGELQQLTTHVTTTTDKQGNVTCEINESRRVSARDRSAELRDLENLGDIEEPSFLDTTPATPVERPRPKDIIEKMRKQMKESYRPEVPTGQLIELRTPPRMIPLPEDVTQEDLLNYSLPAYERTPTKTPVRTPTTSAETALDVSIPHMFKATPPPPTPPLRPVSPLRHRIPSPEGPIVIPPHPKDPTDFKAICRRARLIQKIKAQEKEESLAAERAAVATAEAAKPKKKERVPISKWTAPPPQKPGKRKKLVMRKRGEALARKTLGKTEKPSVSEEVEYGKEPPPLPENYAKEVARARFLAGLKNKTAALNPKVAAREAAKAEAARKAKELEEARLAALNAPPPSPIRDYGTLLNRIAAMKERGIVPRGRPSLASAAYLNAVKSALQIQQQQVCQADEAASYESPQARYKKIMARRDFIPPPIQESPIRTPRREDIPYSPIRFVSPRMEDDTPEAVGDQKFSMPDLQTLQELEELGEIEEPSFMDVNQYPLGEDEYIPLTPPPSPPPQTADIIKRLRDKYQQEQAAVSPERISFTPAPLAFPEELPTEELFEVSVPCFAQSPLRTETPIRSPNISIPHYFEKTPPPKVATPQSRSVSPARSERLQAKTEAIQETTPLLGICPGVKVKTPEGPIRIPPHPKDPTDIAAMIRRSQLIHKLRTKEAAEKAAAAKAAKIRIPISRRAVAPTTSNAIRPVPQKGKLMRRLVLKKKPTAEKPKTLAPSSVRECPTEPPELPADYVAEVARARKLAGLKRKALDLANTKKEKVLAAQPKPTPPPPGYANIMEKIAALRAKKLNMQKGLTARELSTRQHLINRQQRQARKRWLQELERIRAQQGYKEPIDLVQLKTPPTAKERLQAIKERIATATPQSVQCPYSPVKTPEIVPTYQPLALPSTPPYQFLENINIPDIEDISMQFCEFDDNDIDIDEADVEDYEFQIAEAAAANNAFLEFENEPEIEAERNVIQTDFDMAQRIQMLQNQFEDEVAEEENLDFLRNEAEAAAAVCPVRNKNRIEILENRLLQPAHTANTAQEEYNMAQRIKILQQQLLQAPAEQYECPEVCQYAEERDEQYDQHNLDDDMMDDFEAMERECI